MAIFIIFYLSIIFNTIQYDSHINNKLNILYEIFNRNKSVSSDLSIFLNPFKTILRDSLKNITHNLLEKKNITQECFDSFNQTIFASNESISEQYLKRFLNLISINTNEISHYDECISDPLKTSYVIIKYFSNNENVETSKMTYYFPDNGIRGFCLPCGCNDSEYIYIINQAINLTKEIYPIRFEVLGYPKKCYTIENEKNEKNNDISEIEIVFNYILLSIIIIDIIICFYSSIAFYISYFFLKCFCCCIKIKKKNLKKKFIVFKTIFSKSRNFHKLNEQNNKDIGLSFVQGIRGINMLFYTIGMVFVIIIHSPSKMFCPQIIKELFQKPFYCLIFYSIKYSPIFLLTCSGAVLGYKFLNFLDEKVKQKNLEENNNNDNYKDKKINLNASLDVLISKNKKAEIDFDLINKSLLFRYIFYQLDKYIMFILVLLFTKYSLYYFTTILTNEKPTWKYFDVFLTKKISVIEMLQNFLLYPRFIFLYNNNDDYDPIFTIIFDYYWLVFNEIILFLIGIIIIYYCAKKKYQIIYFIVVICSICILFKFFCYLFKININNGNDKYAPYILTYSYYGKIIINPLSNIGVYLIGIYFGILLYAYQKEITARRAESQGKRFMNKISLKLIRILKNTKNNKSFIFSIISLFLVIIYSIGQIFLNSDSSNGLDKIFNFLFVFDNEIIIFFTFNAIFYLMITMNIELFSFLKSKFWRILHKIYFIYIIFVIPVILFFVYHSNSKILFNFTNIMFYSTIIIAFTFIIGLCFYIIGEMPLKNIIRAIYKKKDKNNIINKIEDIDSHEGNNSTF